MGSQEFKAVKSVDPGLSLLARLSRVRGASLGLLGYLAVFGSAFCFYLATAVIRWAKGLGLDPAFFVFSRFLLGFMVVFGLMVYQRQKPRARRFHLILGRTVTNVVAVYCFFKAVETTTVAQGNLLNMTYPIFVAIFSWIFLKAQRDGIALILVGVAFAGIWLVLSPSNMNTGLNSLWGLASGITASFSMIYLNLSRQYHDSQTILFYMFGIGTLLIYLVFHASIFVPNAQAFYYLALCSLLGIGGQYLLTFGFRYVTAVEGGIISSTRILLAALLGPVIASDPPLSLSGHLGALLLFVANVCLALRRARQGRTRPR